MLVVLMYPSEPVTVVHPKHAATSSIANVQSRHPLKKNERAVGFVLVIAALLLSGPQQTR